MFISKVFPNSHKYALDNVVDKRRCNRCNSLVLVEPNADIDYPYYCAMCDENMYEIETHCGRAGVLSEIDDLAVIISQTMSLDGDNAAKYENLFLDLLDYCGFELMKYKSVISNAFFLYDHRLGSILDISEGEDEFLYSSAEEIIDRLDTYFHDSFIVDIEECLTSEGHKVPEYGCYAELLEYAKPLLPDCENELDIVDMVVNHADEIDLELACKIYSLNCHDRRNYNEMVSD